MTTVDLLFDKYVLQIKTKIVSCHTADSKPVKKEVNGTVIIPPLVFPVPTMVSIRKKENVYSVGTSSCWTFVGAGSTS